MAEENNFWIDLVATLKKGQSKKQVQSDAKNLGDIYVPLIGKLSPKSKTIAQLKKDLSGVEIPVNLTGKVNKKGIVTSVQQATTQAQAQANKAPIQVSMNLKKDKLINDIKIFGQQNTKLFKDANMTAKYNSLLDNAKLATSAKQIQDLRMQLSAMRSEIKATNLSGLTLGDTFKKTFKRATELFTGTGGVMLLSQQLRKAWTEALSLDKAYTDLIKVQSELTRGDYPEYLERCNKKAQELATTQQALIESTTEFSKSGYNLTDSNALAEQATVLSNVGDMSASDSAKAIISGVQAYDVIDGYEDVEKKAEALIDKYNEIGNTASITTAEIAQGVQSVGSVFADANTSVDEFIALLAAGNRQYQDADALALGLRTSALRIRGCTAELELMGEETEGVITTTAKLEEKIKALTDIDGIGGMEGVSILEADGETFRDIFEIYSDIGEVYQDMSDTDQSALLELIAGKHRASAISATLNNMSEAQEIYQRSLESSGSAQAEYDKYLLSSEASLNQFKATMTETYQSVLNGDTVTGILNCGNATLQFANSIGLVESSLKGLVAIGIVKAITTLSTAFKASAISASNFGTALNTVKNMSSMARGTTEYTNALNTLKVVSAGMTDVQLKQVLSSKALSDADRITILRTTGLTKAQAQAKLAQMGLTQSTKAQTTAQKTATASTFSLTAAVKGFGASLKAAFLSNPVGIAIMAISTALGAVTSAIDSANQKAEEARQKAKDAASEASSLGDEIVDLASKYLSLSEAVNTDNSAKEDLMTTQTELLKKLQAEGESIDDLISKYGTLDEAIKQLTLDELSNMENDLIAGVKAAEEELKDIGKDYEHWYSLTNRNLLSSGGDDAVKAYEVLEDAGIISSGSYGTGGGSVVLTGDDSTVSGILENYQKLQDGMKALRESGKFTEEELKDNPVFEQLYNRSKEMESFVNNYNTAISDLNKNSVQQMMITSLKGTELPDTREEFEQFRDELIKTAQSSDDFIGTTEDIEKAVNNYLATVSEFSWYFNQSIQSGLTKSEEDIKASASNILSGNSDIIDSYQSQIKAIEGYIDDLREGTLTQTDVIDIMQEMGIDPSKVDLSTSSFKGLEAELTRIANLSFNNLKDTFGDTSQYDNPEAVNELIDSFEKMKTQATEFSFSDSIAELARLEEEMQLLNDIMKEQSENGYISLSTMLSLVEAGYATALQFDATTGACTINRDAMLDLVRAKIKNQIIDLQNLKTDIASKLKDDGVIASESSKGFIDLAKAKLADAEATALQQKASIGDFNNAEAQINALQNAMKNLDKIGSGTYTTGFDSSSTKDATQKSKEYIESYMEFQKKSLEKGMIDYNTYCNTVSNLLKKMYDEGKIAGKDYYDYQKKMLESQKDVMDRVLSAVTNRIDEEISAIEKQKDAIQSTIDKLREENEEHERAVNLEKAKYDLAKLQTQRTKKLYAGSGKGFIYTTDNEAIRDAQKEVQDLEFEEVIEGLEKEKEKLGESIEKLQDYKKQWQSVTDKYQKEQDELLAAQILGADYEDKILSGRLDILRDFESEYLRIQQSIVDMAWQSANEQNKAMNSIGTGDTDGGAEITKTSSNGETPYWTYQSLGTYDNIGEAHNMAGSNDVIKVGNKYQVVKWIKGFATSGQANSSLGFSDGNGVYKRYHTGLEEGIIGSDEKNKNFELLKKLCLERNLKRDEVPIIAERGEVVLTPLQVDNMSENFRKLYEYSQTHPIIPNYTPNINLPKLDSSMMNKTMQQNVTIGDIHLHDVQNVKDFGAELNKYLPSVSIQFRGKL